MTVVLLICQFSMKKQNNRDLLSLVTYLSEWACFLFMRKWQFCFFIYFTWLTFDMACYFCFVLIISQIACFLNKCLCFNCFFLLTFEKTLFSLSTMTLSDFFDKPNHVRRIKFVMVADFKTKELCNSTQNHIF